MPDKRCCWSLADKTINRSDSENTNTNGMRDTTKNFSWSKRASSRSIVVQEGLAHLPTISDDMSEELHNVMGEIHSIDKGKIEWHVLNNSGRATLFGVA